MQEILLQYIFAFFGTAAFSLLFNVPKKYFFTCGFTGAGGWMTYLFMLHTVRSPVVAAFVAASVVAFISRLLSLNKKCPVTVFLIAGIFPLIPGSGIYYMAYEAINNQPSDSFLQGIEALKIAGAMAFGIQLVLSVPKRLF